MYEPDKELILRNQVLPALQVLAAEADVQVTLYPPFCCPLQQVSQENDPCFAALLGNFGDELTDDQRRLLERLEEVLAATTEADLDCSAGPLKTELPENRKWGIERKILENAHWSNVRLLARQALSAFNIERKDPSPARETKPNVWEGP